VLHQILQWHHMPTGAGYPADHLQNLEFNLVWNGIFHASTYVFVAIGLSILWRAVGGWWLLRQGQAENRRRAASAGTRVISA
jgi:uncharacterized membrane protein